MCIEPRQRRPHQSIHAPRQPGTDDPALGILQHTTNKHRVRHCIPHRLADPREPERGDWPTMPDATTELWHETIAQLGAARQELLDALEKVHEEDLYTQVPRAQGTQEPRNTRAQTASGLLEHDIYHLGQIALLKKALRVTV